MAGFNGLRCQPAPEISKAMAIPPLISHLLFLSPDSYSPVFLFRLYLCFSVPALKILKPLFRTNRSIVTMPGIKRAPGSRKTFQRELPIGKKPAPVKIVGPFREINAA
jgi:hypothetical protein